MKYKELTSTGLVIESENKDLSGNTLIVLVSPLTPNCKVLVRNQSNSRNDFWTIGLYDPDRARQMVNRWVNSR